VVVAFGSPTARYAAVPAAATIITTITTITTVEIAYLLLDN
jgi:hypothetical protein